MPLKHTHNDELMNKRLLSICFCLGCLLPTFAQTDDLLPADSAGEGLSRKEARALRRQRVAKRNLHYNIMGGPGYTCLLYTSDAADERPRV